MIPTNPYTNRQPINFATLPREVATVLAAMTHLPTEVVEWAQIPNNYDKLIYTAQKLIDAKHMAEHPRLFASFIAYAYEKFGSAKGLS